MYTRRAFQSALLLVGLLASCLSQAQDATPSIRITGDVQQPLTLSADELKTMARASVRVSAKGVDTTYEGVWLHEVLKKCSVPQGADLRGKGLTTYVPLAGQQGRFKLVSPKEKRPARSVRMLTMLEVVQVKK